MKPLAIKLTVPNTTLLSLGVTELFGIIEKTPSLKFRGYLSTTKDKTGILANLPITKFSVITPRKNIFTGIENNFEPYTKTETCYPLHGICKTGEYVQQSEVIAVLNNNINLIPKILD